MNKAILYDKELEKEVFHLTSLSINEEAKLAEIFGFTFDINVFDFLETEITFRTSNEFMDNEINDDEEPLKYTHKVEADKFVHQQAKKYIDQYTNEEIEESIADHYTTKIKDAISELYHETTYTASEVKTLLERELEKLSEIIYERKDKLESDIEELIIDYQAETGCLVYAINLVAEKYRGEDNFVTVLMNEQKE